MNQRRRLDKAVEELRWQFDNAPEYEGPGGAAFALQKSNELEPETLILYAWGDGAKVVYAVLEANGLTENNPDCRRFPPKPDPN